MKERPIIFSSEMVRAILDGRKTQTRRPIKPPPPPLFRERYEIHPIWNHPDNFGFYTGNELHGHKLHYVAKCPFGESRNKLWVRETWCPLQDIKACAIENEPVEIAYRADDGWMEASKDELEEMGIKWKPSIFMPRWVSRITIEITNLRVERLQDITFEDALAEGCKDYLSGGYDFSINSSCARANFHRLWDSINSNFNLWIHNPWVWVIEFKRIGD